MAEKKSPGGARAFSLLLAVLAFVGSSSAQTARQSTRLRFGVLDAHGESPERVREFLEQPDVPIRAVVGDRSLAEPDVAAGDWRARVEFDGRALVPIGEPFSVGDSGIFAQRFRAKNNGREFLFTFGRGQNPDEVARYVRTHSESLRNLSLVAAVRGDATTSVEAASETTTRLLETAFANPRVAVSARTRFVTASSPALGMEMPQSNWFATSGDVDLGEVTLGEGFEFGLTDVLSGEETDAMKPSELAAKIPKVIEDWLASDPLRSDKLRTFTPPTLSKESSLRWKSNEFTWRDDNAAPPTEHHCSFRVVFALEDDSRWYCQAIGYHLAIDMGSGEIKPRPLAEVPGIQKLLAAITGAR